MKKNDDDLKWIHENFEYIDSLTAIDDTGKIIVKKGSIRDIPTKKTKQTTNGL